MNDQPIIQYVFSKDTLKQAIIEVFSEYKGGNILMPDIKPPATRHQACKYLSISLPTLDKLIKSKEITVFNIGRQVRINWPELEKYVNRK